MITNIIETKIKTEYSLVDKGSYEIKNPYYNMLILNNKPKDIMEQLYEFPIEIKRRVKKIIYLPFKLGRVVWESIK